MRCHNIRGIYIKHLKYSTVDNLFTKGEKFKEQIHLPPDNSEKSPKANCFNSWLNLHAQDICSNMNDSIFVGWHVFLISTLHIQGYQGSMVILAGEILTSFLKHSKVPWLFMPVGNPFLDNFPQTIPIWTIPWDNFRPENYHPGQSPLPWQIPPRNIPTFWWGSWPRAIVLDRDCSSGNGWEFWHAT